MRIFPILISVTIFCIVTSCSEKPTVDASAVATSVVQTYQAELTQNATATILPSGTPSPILTQVPVDTTPTIEMTSIKPTANIPDKAEFISQTPKDNTEIRINSKFRVTWALRNIGKTTWKRNYKIRYYAGAALGERSEYNLLEDVPPGGVGKFFVNMVTPAYVGDFTTIWVLTNSDGQNFSTVYLTISAVNRKPRTPTPLPTLTPTITPK